MTTADVALRVQDRRTPGGDPIDPTAFSKPILGSCQCIAIPYLRNYCGQFAAAGRARSRGNGPSLQGTILFCAERGGAHGDRDQGYYYGSYYPV
jgi:hypothetical protein